MIISIKNSTEATIRRMHDETVAQAESVRGFIELALQKGMSLPSEFMILLDGSGSRATRMPFIEICMHAGASDHEFQTTLIHELAHLEQKPRLLALSGWAKCTARAFFHGAAAFGAVLVVAALFGVIDWRQLLVLIGLYYVAYEGLQRIAHRIEIAAEARAWEVLPDAAEAVSLERLFHQRVLLSLVPAWARKIVAWGILSSPLPWPMPRQLLRKLRSQYNVDIRRAEELSMSVEEMRLQYEEMMSRIQDGRTCSRGELIELSVKLDAQSRQRLLAMIGQEWLAAERWLHESQAEELQARKRQPFICESLVAQLKDEARAKRRATSVYLREILENRHLLPEEAHPERPLMQSRMRGWLGELFPTAGR